MKAVLTTMGASVLLIPITIARECDTPIEFGKQIKFTTWTSEMGAIRVPMVFPLKSEYVADAEEPLPKANFYQIQDYLRAAEWIEVTSTLSTFSQGIDLTSNSLSRVMSLVSWSESDT